MGKGTYIDELGIGDEVLEEYIRSGYNLSGTARKFSLVPQDILYYTEIVKTKEPERWEKIVKNQEVDVIRKITSLIGRVEKKLDAWENDPDKEGKFLMAVSSTRDNLKLYVDILDKIYSQKQQIQFRKAILDAIRDVDPAVAQKIVLKIREMSDTYRILE